MAFCVHLPAALELPRQEGAADTPVPPSRMDACLQADAEGVAERRQRQHRGPRDEVAVRSADGHAVALEVEEVVDPPLGQVVDVPVLTGVVDRLGSLQQHSRCRDVVVRQGPCDQTLGQGREIGHDVAG